MTQRPPVSEATSTYLPCCMQQVPCSLGRCIRGWMLRDLGGTRHATPCSLPTTPCNLQLLT
jgi:hypothetical protein